MKRIIIILVAMSCWTSAFSQTKMSWNDKNTQAIINGAPFIFEGKVIDTLYYNNCSLVAVKVQIIHILRGNLNPGTIELVDNLGGRWENGIFMHKMIGERDRPMQPGTKGIFLCKISSFKPSPMKTDNEIRVISTGLIFFSPGGWIECFNKVFYSKKELNDFLSKYPNITIPKEEIKQKK